MSLPFFYHEHISPETPEVLLDESTSRHVVQVLRMQKGEEINLTDGRGSLFRCEIADAHKKNCRVKISQFSKNEPPAKQVCIAVSILKNSSRFEWFLEKAAEMGVSEIVPLLCARTEKQHFRFERMKGILVSAMLQSQQVWLTSLAEPIKYGNYVASVKDEKFNKLIAHCEEVQNKVSLLQSADTGQHLDKSTVLIGPEGDFTKDEILTALESGFAPVMLGNTRLRTETAALVVAALLCMR